MSHRRWLRRLAIFYKINKGLTPSYLSAHIPKWDEINMVLHNKSEKNRVVGNSFFPHTIKSWKNLGEQAKTKPPIDSFRKYTNNFIRPPGKSLFAISDRFRIKLLSDHHEHRFHHNFTCKTSVDLMTKHQHMCALEHITLLSKISDIVHSDISVLLDDHLTHILVYGTTWPTLNLE